MASVDGAKTYLASSDEAHLNNCGPCKDAGDDKEATYYCEQCDEYLCSACKDYHKRFKASKNHNILSANVRTKQNSISPTSTPIITCNCNNDLEVEIYCKEHAEVLCSSCATIKHRKCKTSPLQDKLPDYSTHQFHSAIENAKELINKIQSYKRGQEEDCQKLEKMKVECRKEIKVFREGICDALEKMEESLLKSLDEKAKKQLLSIEKKISTLSIALKALNVDKDLLEKANRSGKEDVMFAADIKTSKSLQEYEALILDIEKESQTPRLLFEKNETLADLQKDIMSLGKIAGNVNLDRNIQSKKNVILDRKIQSSKIVNIQLQEDKDCPSIAGCTFMSNGYIVLIDNKNKKVKLLDNFWKVSSSLSMQDTPWNVALISDHQAVLTFSVSSESGLRFITTLPELKLGIKIKLPGRCLGVEVAHNEIFTAYHSQSGRDEIWRLDQSGNIISKIRLVQNSSDAPFYLCLQPTGNNYRIYLTYYSSSTLTCLENDGNIVFQFQDQDLKRANGIYVDSEGNALVCGTNSNNVLVVTADGKKHKELLTIKDNIRKPKAIAFRAADGTLIVGCEGSSDLFIYKFAE